MSKNEQVVGAKGSTMNSSAATTGHMLSVKATKRTSPMARGACHHSEAVCGSHWPSLGQHLISSPLYLTEAAPAVHTVRLSTLRLSCASTCCTCTDGTLKKGKEREGESR